VKGLLAKKMFRKYRVLGHGYLVVLDGTHVMDVQKGHCDPCLHQPFKNGKMRFACRWRRSGLRMPRSTRNKIVNSRRLPGLRRPSSSDTPVCQSVWWPMDSTRIEPFFASVTSTGGHGLSPLKRETYPPCGHGWFNDKVCGTAGERRNVSGEGGRKFTAHTSGIPG
jgi:hypothetical protein